MYLTVHVRRASSATTPWSVITARFSSSPRATVAMAAQALASTCRWSDLSRLTSSSRPPTRLRTSSAESFAIHRHSVPFYTTRLSLIVYTLYSNYSQSRPLHVQTLLFCFVPCNVAYCYSTVGLSSPFRCLSGHPTYSTPSLYQI